MTTGCVALKALLNKTDSHSYEEAYEKATAQQFDKWITEKCQLEKELSILKNQIKEMEENDKVPLLCETWYESESDTVMREHDHNLSTQREINHEAEQLIAAASLFFPSSSSSSFMALSRRRLKFSLHVLILSFSAFHANVCAL